MCLFSINMPDYSGKLSAINGNLYDITKNTEKMGYSLDSIRKDIRRVADASEVVAGIITKEEIQIQQAIERIRKTDSVMSGVFGYEEAPAHVQAEADINQLKIEKLYQKLELIKDERENKLLELCGEDK